MERCEPRVAISPAMLRSSNVINVHGQRDPNASISVQEGVARLSARLRQLIPGTVHTVSLIARDGAAVRGRINDDGVNDDDDGANVDGWVTLRNDETDEIFFIVHVPPPPAPEPLLEPLAPGWSHFPTGGPPVWTGASGGHGTGAVDPLTPAANAPSAPAAAAADPSAAAGGDDGVSRVVHCTSTATCHAHSRPQNDTCHLLDLLRWRRRSSARLSRADQRQDPQRPCALCVGRCGRHLPR